MNDGGPLPGLLWCADRAVMRMCQPVAHFCFCKGGFFMIQARKGEGLTVNPPPPTLWSSPVGSKDATTAAKKMRQLDKRQEIEWEADQHCRGWVVWWPEFLIHYRESRCKCVRESTSGKCFHVFLELQVLCYIHRKKKSVMTDITCITIYDNALLQVWWQWQTKTWLGTDLHLPGR